MENCNGCGRDVSTKQEKKQRRLLSSCTVQGVVQTLRTFICKVQRNQEGLEDTNGFICRSCVRLLERYNQVNEEVLSNVVKALQVLRSRHSMLQLDSGSAGTSVVQHNPPSQLPVSPAAESAPSTATSKRHHQDTDTGSPALTVSAAKN